MKPIIEVYPELAERSNYFYCTGDYTPMLESLGYKIVLKVDDDDYQGDSRLLLQDGPHRFGLLVFGWGSCSGCDALQACGSIQEIEDLRTQLHNEIIWKNSAEEMYDFIKNRDWEVQYSYHRNETKDFITRALGVLGE